MPKLAKTLSEIEIRRLRYDGKGRRTLHAVGGAPGLALQCTPSGGRMWVLRYAVGKLRRELALGSYPAVTLAEARTLAGANRGRIAQGADPVAERAAAREEAQREAAPVVTFSKAVDEYLAFKLAEFSNAKHKAQWRSTLDTYAGPVLGDMAVDQITNADVLKVLKPIWTTKTETASRLRGRIEAVLDWATSAGHRQGVNPATWRGNLAPLLPSAAKLKAQRRESQPAVSLDDVPDWFAALRTRDGMAARALEFACLCASRSGEVRGATWSEIDLDKAVWTVPARRMKAGRPHTVALSEAAVRLLRLLPRLKREPDDNRPDYVFWAPRGGMLSDMALSAVMRRMHEAEVKAGRTGWLDRVSGRPAVPHGLRSSFRDWAAECTNYPREVAEIALAHSVGSAVERAYRRGDMVEKRRALMADWADFIGADKKGLAVVEGR